MKEILMLAALVCLLLAPVSNAHFGEAEKSMGLGDDPITVYHDDNEDNDDKIYAGVFQLTITNTGQEAWGNFHFGVASGTVVFGQTANYPSLLIAGQPVDLDVTLSPDQKQLDLEFYDTPILYGQTAVFSIYTNNPDGGMFGICFWPTPVPEPATLAMLGLGGLALLRRKRR